MVTDSRFSDHDEREFLEDNPDRTHLGEIDEKLERDIERERASEESQNYADLDDLFGILSNSRRRTVIRYMKNRQTDAPFELGNIAEEIAVVENNKDSISELKSQERKRVYVALHQTHLSKIEEYGAIEYNKNRNLVDFPEDGPENHRFSELADFVKPDVRTSNQEADDQYFDYISDNLNDGGYLSGFLDRLSL